MPKPELKVTIKDRKEYEKFLENAKKLEGGPRGVKSRGLEASIKIMNCYFEEFDNQNLYKISKELNLPPWKVGSILIKIAIKVYNKYKNRFFDYCRLKGVKSEDEHLRLVDEFFEELDTKH